MKTFVANFVGKKFGEVKAFPSRTLAGKHGNGYTVFSDPEDLVNNESVKIHQMVAFYNHHNKTNPVTDFATREAAAEKIFNLAQAKAEIVQIQKEIETMTTVKETIAAVKKTKAAKAEKAPKAPKAPKAEKAAAPVKEKAEKAPRKSEYAGMKIYPAEFLAENPRREGGFGYKAMDFILNNPGATYEEYIAAGGRRQDLAWDLEKGHVTLSR